MLRLVWYVVTNGAISVFLLCLYVSRLGQSGSLLHFFLSLMYVGLYAQLMRWYVRLRICVGGFGCGTNAVDADGLTVWNTLECVWGVA